MGSIVGRLSRRLCGVWYSLMSPPSMGWRWTAATSGSPGPVAAGVGGVAFPAVGPLGVVVLDVLADHCVQMPATEDEHAVGEFGSDGAHEPFRVAVRLRAPRWNSQTLIPAPASTASNVVENWPARSRIRLVNEAARRRGQQVGCGPAGWSMARRIGGGSEDVDVAGVDLDDEEHVNPCATRWRSRRGRNRRPAPSMPEHAETVATADRCHE